MLCVIAGVAELRALRLFIKGAKKIIKKGHLSSKHLYRIQKHINKG